MGERVFPMPDLGEGLEDGRIVGWLVLPGEAVELNQPLVEIETAKATVEVPSPFAGVVATLHGAAGETVAVGAALVTFTGVAGEEVAPAAPATPTAARSGEEPDRGGGPRATPPVRKLAASLGIDLATVTGTGPGGRVLAEDVARSAARTGTPGAPESIGVDTARAQLARIVSAQAAIPQVTTFRTVDCTELQAFREREGMSPMPVVIAALARIAGHHPVATAVWSGDGVRLRPDVNVGFAVETGRGLVVPVVHDVPSWGLVELTAELRRLAHAAREGDIAPGDLTGATIAVTNMGSYGSEAGTPILSPGTSVTLGIGAIAPRALVVDGEVVGRPACTLSLTFDHRVMDGAAAGAALTDLVALLQSPERLRDLAG